MDKLNQLLKFGQINFDQYSLAAAQAFEKIDQQTNQFAAPKAVQAGSAEAVSLAIRAAFGQQREDPQKRIRQEELEKQQLAAAKQIAEALRNRDKVVKLPG